MASIEKYRRKTLLRYVVKLAHEIRVGVCVEGIEYKDMLEFFREMGADEGQGFYLGRRSKVSAKDKINGRCPHRLSFIKTQTLCRAPHA